MISWVSTGSERDRDNVASADSIDVTVLTPVLDEARHLPEVLERMTGQTFAGSIEFLFIDGGSTDDTRHMIEAARKSDPRIKLLDNPRRTTVDGLNIGLESARGEFIARMDAHTFYPVEYLATGVARLKRGDVEWVAGPAIAVGRDSWSRRIALALTSRLGYGGANFRRAASSEFDARSGFAGVWKRSTIERHGGWDPGWPVNQDAELAARVTEAGERIVCVPEMAADYIPRNSLRALAKQYFVYGQYRCKTSGRHPDSLNSANLLPPGLALTASAALASPRVISRFARAALVVYLTAVGIETARMAVKSSEAGDVLAVPAVFATMHLAHGFGFLAGSLRFGVPFVAIGRALRRALPVERKS